MKKLIACLSLLVAIVTVNAQTTFFAYSPDHRLKVTVQVGGDAITYTVDDDYGKVIDNSSISLDLGEQGVLGLNPSKTFRKGTRNSIRQQVTTPLYKKSTIADNYSELALVFKNNFQVKFRVYDSGVAYRFETTFPDSVEVRSETAEFNFPQDVNAYIPYVVEKATENGDFSRQFCTSFENTYTEIPLKEMNDNRLAFMPVLVELPEGRKVVITESDLRDYPGMYIKHTEGNSVMGFFAPVPKKWEQGGHNNLQYLVKEREEYIAKTAGTRTYPWRVIAISRNDKELANNDLVYLLATPSQLADISWIKPGKVAWDWWNNWNIWGVDFEAGINNDTYKYYIDFAAKSGMEYVILDEGWSVNKKADLFQVVPEIDLPMLVNYAKSKGVGIVLWAGYAAIDKDMEKVCKHYSEMGVKGFKVDFMDRDDQIVVNFYERMAATAAKYHLFIDFHGAYKPTGLSRTYPNVLNYEGVFGLEQCKWAPTSVDMVKYEVTIPFIRMLAGPLDFTQGAMSNAAKGCYQPLWSEPMSQGTRCRQLAEYVIFESPFAMLCDAPTAYLSEPECTEFIAKVPTVWDETRVLDGEVGKYIVTARRNGNKWYIGAITDWDSRTITVDLSGLGITSGKATLFVDGANAHRKGSDYKKKSVDVPADGKLKLELAPGGGAVVIL
ncbi:MAG: glycoside hydrolase family 97 protein [Bacteroidales bacterium]|nr:glycoside hydrolase family 97 protein [Bacteroidales bacterium]